ncbi:helY [Symbiodinium natans]|uniref:HelY protein n=1 Tax=Symbiodinium natans TaxID=878477 RepID=A0A812L5Y7_9DINO|nr:helY [Symbiodinium natans]
MLAVNVECVELQGRIPRRRRAGSQTRPTGPSAHVRASQPNVAAVSCLLGLALGGCEVWRLPRLKQKFQRGFRRLRAEPEVSTVARPEADTDLQEGDVMEVQSGHVPWLQKHLPQEEDCEDLLLLFMQALEERGVQLYKAQEEAIVEIFSGAHVVLDTPTGSGKSLVAVAALFKALAEGNRAYYTSPTKALTSEKFFDLCRHFGPASVGMATGDISLNQRAPLICCTAEVLASISLHEGEASGISTVVMDEFHYFADPDRGSAWEVPLWRMTGTAFLLMLGFRV